MPTFDFCTYVFNKQSVCITRMMTFETNIMDMNKTH